MEFSASKQYYAVVRAYGRLKKICTDNGPAISNTEAKDAATDFFIQCYHLKDWLNRDKVYKPQEDLEVFITQSKGLLLTQVYCNSMKHAGPDRKVPAALRFSGLLTHCYLLQRTPKGLVNFSRIEMTFGVKKYDGLILATRCMLEWEKFLVRNGIEFPPP